MARFYRYMSMAKFDSAIIPSHGGDCFREWNHWYYFS